ncbi:MAG: hypothetical protein WBB29_22765, partial [Geitlerinemataceae cyanobacterium]
LVRLLDAAKTLYPAVSLSVRRDNPAMRLYRRLGFQVVEGCDSLNRTGGISVTLKLDLSQLKKELKLYSS